MYVRVNFCILRPVRGTAYWEVDAKNVKVAEALGIVVRCDSGGTEVGRREVEVRFLEANLGTEETDRAEMGLGGPLVFFVAYEGSKADAPSRFHCTEVELAGSDLSKGERGILRLFPVGKIAEGVQTADG